MKNIYTLNYLINNELTEEDLHYLFDENMLNKSLVIEMFNIAKYKISPKKIINMCSTDEKWMYSFHWTKKQREKFVNLLTEAFKNIYQYKNIEARHNAEWWTFFYGLSIKGENLLID